MCICMCVHVHTEGRSKAVSEQGGVQCVQEMVQT